MPRTGEPDVPRRVREPSLADAIIPPLPARVFRAGLARRGLAPASLSRLTAGSATVTSPLIAQNSCGVFMGAAPGVSAFRDLALPVFCYASPLALLLMSQPRHGRRRASDHG